MMTCINKKSVELTSVYPIEGWGKTRSWTNGTIPHTLIDMGYRGTLNVPVHEYLYESECCPYHPHDLENFHIFDRGLAKNTFTICNARRQMQHDTTNVNIFLLRATRTKESSDNDIDDGNFKTVNTTSPKKKYSHGFIGA